MNAHHKGRSKTRALLQKIVLADKRTVFFFTAGSKNFDLYKNMISSKWQEIWVLFTIWHCAKETELAETQTKMSRLSTLLQNLFLVTCYGVLFLTAFETDKFYVALGYLVWISHPGLLFNVFYFPVSHYLNELVPHCFSLWYFVQHHGTRSHARVVTMTRRDVSSDLMLFPHTHMLSGLLHFSSHPPWFKNELFSVSRWTSSYYLHFFPVQGG